MKSIKPSIQFFIDLGKTQTILANRFDRSLGGLGFNEFLILFYINQSDNQKMRRVDLADKIGMTASGVTRLLLPMEKVGLVKSGSAEKDARVRFVSIASGGKQKLSEAIERLGFLADDIIPNKNTKEIQTLSKLLVEIGGRALMK